MEIYFKYRMWSDFIIPAILAGLCILVWVWLFIISAMHKWQEKRIKGLRKENEKDGGKHGTDDQTADGRNDQ